eukprot:5749254-Pleurochrysis_carterae.AAC.11
MARTFVESAKSWINTRKGCLKRGHEWHGSANERFTCAGPREPRASPARAASTRLLFTRIRDELDAAAREPERQQRRVGAGHETCRPLVERDRNHGLRSDEIEQEKPLDARHTAAGYQPPAIHQEAPHKDSLKRFTEIGSTVSGRAPFRSHMPACVAECGAAAPAHRFELGRQHEQRVRLKPQLRNAAEARIASDNRPVLRAKTGTHKLEAKTLFA